MKNILPKVAPHAIAVAVFMLVTFAFFAPAFKGYRVIQSDMRTSIGAMQEGKFYQEYTGEFTAWVNNMFSGMPGFQITNYTDFDGNIAGFIGRFIYHAIPQPAGIWFMYALSFYVLLLALRIRPLLAGVGALAFAFSTYFIIILEVGHITKALAVSYAPFIFAGFVWLTQGKYSRGLWVMSLAFAVELYSNHVQITYYFGILLLILALSYAIYSIREKSWSSLIKVASLSMVAALVGVFCNFSALYTTYQYSKETTRSESELTIGVDGKAIQGNKTTGLDKDYITAWSYGIQESWTLLIPNAKGGATGMIGENKALDKADPQFRQNLAQQNHYWGDQSFTEGPVYLGAGIVLLFVLGLILLEGYYKWALGIGFALSLALSWGKNFMPLTDFFIENVPGYNKFRAVTIVMVVLEFCAPLLAVLFVQKLIDKREELLLKKKVILYGGGSLMGILLLFLITPDSFFTFFNTQESEALNKQAQENPEMAATIQSFIENLKTVRIEIFKQDVMRSLFFAAATGALIYAYVIKAFKQQYLILALGLLTLGDLYTVNKRYLNADKQNGQYVQWEPVKSSDYPFVPTANDLEIYNRELSNSGLSVIPGLSSNTLFADTKTIRQKTEDYLAKRREERLQSGVLEPMSDGELGSIQFGVLNLFSNYRVLNLTVSPFNDASTSYFHKSLGGYHGAKLKRYQELIDFHFAQGINQGVLNMLNTKYIITQEGVQQNAMACGNAWYVDKIQWVKNANEEILALKGFDPRQTVFIDERFKDLVKNNQVDSIGGSIRQLSYAPNKLVYESESATDRIALFSEIYSPGWQVSIDGKPEQFFRCNYVLRGLSIPAGKHKIVAEYKPDSIALGYKGSMVGSVLLALVFLLGIFFEIKGSKSEA